MNNSYLKLVAAAIMIALGGCTWEKPAPAAEEIPDPCENYPDNIAAIMIAKCATPGCHNASSKDAASGLELTTWQTMYKGNNTGSVVIPFNSQYSTVFTFCNIYDSLGFTGQLPKMPLNQSALSYNEVKSLRDWIDAGAPSKCGTLRFPDLPSRRKFVITQQGCDQITVFDAESKMAMKHFEIGDKPGATGPQNEGPHVVKYTPDGRYYIVVMLSGLVQRFDAVTDELVDELNLAAIPPGWSDYSWGTLAISPDSKTAYCAYFVSGQGKIAKVNLQNLPMTGVLIPANYDAPHGLCVSENNHNIFITSNSGNANKIYKTTDTTMTFPDDVQLIQNIPTQNGNACDPHEVLFSPDGNRYFVTCQGSNEVRVYQTLNDSILAAIPVGRKPLEMAFSANFPYLFVTCNTEPVNGTYGSVSVINYNTNQEIKRLFTGTNPHGIAVDDLNGLVYVVHQNLPGSNGQAPHHVGACAGQNGNLTLIDMHTLELVRGFKFELTVNPYTVAIKP